MSGCVPTPWVLGGCYQAGQLVTYNGYLYVANVDNAAGVPGESADFTLLSTLQPVGPTGPAGPVGPTGAVYLGKATICKNAASCQTASLWVLTSINS